jgi:DNA-binding NarL/FixJ family response regulator
VTEQPLRIAVCEDDENLAMLIVETLESDGRFVVVGRARTGDEAIALAVQETPDVILMDIGMPGRDGIEATREIQSHDNGQHVVVYTGSDEYADVARADEAGAVGFLHKEALRSPDLAEAIYVLHANYVSGISDD